MMATQEEIERLKKNWLGDPCWDIELTEGFEEHEAELLAFRKERDLELRQKVEDRIARRARVVEIDTDITKPGAAQAISTYQEIEDAVAAQDKYIGACESRAEVIQLELAQAQVRATLLLAAQTQRVANGIWELLASMESSDNQDFMFKLHQVD